MYIPIGSDCNPAYILKILNHREFSLPFDWLDTSTLYGLDYVRENIEYEFINFKNEMILNEYNIPICKKYPNTTFMHHKSIVLCNKKGIETHNSFDRRIKRFMDIYKDNDIHKKYLYCLNNDKVLARSDVHKFITSVKTFVNIMSNEDKLLIYIRFDNKFNENNNINLCDLLMKKCNDINNVHCVKYIREKDEYGRRGNKRNYLNLLNSFENMINH